MNHDDQSRELLQPILDLMSGLDGGVGFTNLRHGFLPEMLARSAAGEEMPAEIVLMVTQFSVLCKTMMGK